MIIDKVPWVSHDGRPISSIDVDSTGARAVTAGEDHKVRVWALPPILKQQVENDASIPQRLATIHDHLGCVGVARFSPKGHFIASGSDGVCLLHQLMPGQGKSTLGSKEHNVENWRLVHSMRGHQSDITDISWCPDGSKLASSCVDNHVIVWDATTGRQIVTLAGHHGHVRGVSWDPFDHYLASQGDQDGIFIWSTSDWKLVARVQEPYKAGLASHSFYARLGWSSDGQTLAGTNAFSKPVHQAPLVRRNAWDAPHQLCGHKASVCVARWNPHLRASRKGPSDDACGICALGSMDRQFTVWNVAEPRPLAVCSQFFNGAVVDLVWTPDGSTLMACSHDGTVAVATFTEQELGRRLPDAEVNELIETLYGNQQKHGKTLLADAQLLTLEMDTGVPSPPPMRPTWQPQAVPLMSASAPTAAPGAGVASIPRQGGLDARLGPGGATLGSAGVGAVGAGGAAPAPTRKRVMPTPVGDTPAGPSSTGAALAAAPVARPVAQAAIPSAAASGARGAASATAGGTSAAGARADGAAPPAKRMAPMPITAGRSNLASASAPAAITAPPAAAAGPLALLGDATTTTTLLAPPAAAPSLAFTLGIRRAPNATHPSQEETVMLEATNNLRLIPGMPMARVQSTASGQTLWFDTVQGSVASLTGTLNFSAASTTQGDLLVFSAAGRRLFPPLCLGGPAAFMANDEGWMLLVLTVDGRLRMWDVNAKSCKLDVSLAPVITSWKSEVCDVRISSSGNPIIILANHHAYTYLADMQTWGRVADDSFTVSHYQSSMAGTQGELGRVQSAAAAARAPRAVMGAHAQPLELQRRASRANLEHNVVAALALQSPIEWKRWLSTYVRQIAADGDVARVREVLVSMVGPVTWTPDSELLEHKAWNPEELGYKKRALLRSDLLREITRPRTPAMQALAQEALELLNNAEKHHPTNTPQPHMLMGSAAGNVLMPAQTHGQQGAKAVNGGDVGLVENGRGGVGQGGVRSAVTGVTPPGSGGGLSWLQTGN